MARLHVGVVIHGCADVSVPCIDNLANVCRYDVSTLLHFYDNGSPEPDATVIRAALMRHSTRPGTVAEHSPINLGCSGGWNAILRRAAYDPECEFALLMGHDAIPHPDAINNLIKRYLKGDVDLVTGVPYEKDGDIEPSDWEHAGPDFSMLLLPMRVYRAVGPFDERFWPAYFEDNDYHHRCKMAGCGYGIRTGMAPFRHYRSSTIRRYAHLNGHFNVNRERFVAKWGAAPDKLGDALPFKGVDSQ